MKKQCFGAAACIIKNKKVLLLHRVSNFDVWEFPGGGIEFGESPEDAAVRETKEETGLKVKSKGFLTINSHVTPQKHHHIWLHYRCIIINGEVKVNKEHTEYGWFSIKEIKKLPNLALSVKHVLPELQKIISD